MSNYEILNLSDNEKWTDYIKKLPIDQQDVFCTPAYYSLFEMSGKGVALCFVYKNNNDLALYPFLKNKINNLGYKLDNEYYDIQGAYGYNGIITNSTETGFLNNFAEVFLDWCKQHRIIAEFLRFNTLLDNHLLSKWVTPIEVLDNVYIPLSSYEDIWLKSFHKKVRKAVRKAYRYGLTYKSFSGKELPNEYLNYFFDAYNHMLDRNNADESYYYSLEYFQQMMNLFPNNTLFSFALFNNTPISVELIIHNDVYAYAFLGGTYSDHLDKSPNTFLRNEIVKELLNKGLKCYNMGGGISRNDSLYLYKKSFSVNVKSKFYIGKKIHNQVVYDELVKQWCMRSPEKIELYNNFVLKYRF